MMICSSARRSMPLAVLAIAILLIAHSLCGEVSAKVDDPPPTPATALEPASPPSPEPVPEPDPEAPLAVEPESPPEPETPPAVEPQVPSEPETPPPTVPAPEPETVPAPGLDHAANPCKQAATFRDAWLDRLRRGVFRTVCGSASWFDNFFGDERAYDQTKVYGRLSTGLLYDAKGDWNERSKFDANIPLPNLSKRATAFLGRDEPEEYIADTSRDLSAPEAFRASADDRSWLAGFGYNPPGKGGSRMSYRLGVKISSDPYVFTQARYRYTRYRSKNTAFRFHETIFYRTNDDKFGSTTYVGYDWIPRPSFMARVSTQGTFTEDTDGLKWKSYATIYQDLALRSGVPRGIAYQLFANGETAEDVPLREYGSIAIYRQQILRQWLLAEVSLGYSWLREERAEEREGRVTVGFVFEILFGDYYDRQ